MKNKEGLRNVGRDEADVLYVIRKSINGTPQYLSIEGFDLVPGQDPTKCMVEGARVAWLLDRRGAAEWIVNKNGHHQVVLKEFNGSKRLGGWWLAGSWVVGLEAAEYLIGKHGGVLVPVVRHRRANRKAA